MKTAMIQLLTFCFLTIPLSTSQAAPLKPIDIANAQDRTGGNVFEAEFKSIGRVLVKQMRQHNLTDEQLGFPIIKFETAVAEVEVLGTDDNALVQVDGEGRQAINSASLHGITFENSTWAILDQDQKRRLVAHEYCRVSGVDDSNWTYSTRLLELVETPAPPPGKTGNVFRITKAVHSYNMGLDGYNLYFNNEAESTAYIWCYKKYQNNDSVALSLGGGLSNIPGKNLGAPNACAKLLAYVATSNWGMEVYLSFSPTDFEIY